MRRVTLLRACVRADNCVLMRDSLHSDNLLIKHYVGYCHYAAVLRAEYISQGVLQQLGACSQATAVPG